MTTQDMLSRLRSAVNTYRLIQDGDRIAVGLSGGKDSLTLLKLLSVYRNFSPEKFQLKAVTIDLGFEKTDKNEVQALKDFCHSIEVDYTIVPSDIGKIVFDIRKEKNPCSLCAKLRRGALNNAAVNLGCNKVALGHHKDDLMETFLLSLLYEGRLSVFSPSSYLSRKNITQIRPLIFLSESEIRSYAADLPVLHNVCPANHHTKREEMKTLIQQFERTIPDARAALFGAITSPERYNLFDKFGDTEHKE